MANRVSVRIDVNDNSRRALASLRQSMQRMQSDARRAGGTIQFNVRIPDGATRRELRRIQRALRDQNVIINTRLDPPDPPPMTLRRRIARALGPITVPVRLSHRGMVSGVRGPLRALGGLVSGTLQDGVGQGLANGFRAGGPIGAAFLAALLIGTFSLIGAALSGLIVTALGAAFVGVGGVSAAMSDQIKAKWSETLGVLKQEFADVGTPLIPVLDRALSKLQDMAKAAGPELRRALEETAPATEKFINSLMDGFKSFGKGAFDRIMEAWNVFAPVFGEQWNEFMRELGDSFGDMADLVKNHPTEIAAALEIVFEAIELIVDIVTFFGKVWVANMNGALDLVGALGKGIQLLGNAALDSFGVVIEAAATAFQWVPGLGGKLKTAAEAFGTFKASAKEKLEGIANAADVMKGALDRANKKRKLEADIASWQAKLTTARADLKKTTDQKARKKIEADIRDLTSKLATARAQIRGLKGKTVTFTYRHVNVYINQNGPGRTVPRGGGSQHDQRARGGTIGAAASGGIRRNLTMVGEHGPELVRLPAGAHVRSNPDTRRLARNDLPKGAFGNFIFKSSGRRVDDLLLEILREAIHQRGGDPVKVLGG
jgi:hypothetical protein